MQAVPAHHFPMAFLQSLQAGALLRGKQRRNLRVHLFENGAHLATGLLAFRLEAGAGAIDDGCDLVSLLRREFQLAAQMLFHVLGDRAGRWMAEQDGAAKMGGAEESAGGAGKEYEDEGERQFPAQRAVHSARLF